LPDVAPGTARLHARVNVYGSIRHAGRVYDVRWIGLERDISRRRLGTASSSTRPLWSLTHLRRACAVRAGRQPGSAGSREATTRDKLSKRVIAAGFVLSAVVAICGLNIRAYVLVGVPMADALLATAFYLGYGDADE
jgi:hypothetical protein